MFYIKRIIKSKLFEFLVYPFYFIIMKKYLIYLFFLCISLFNFKFIYADDNVDYTAKVDCSVWNDTTWKIQLWETSSLPYLTLKKATEEIVKLNNVHTNSRFWIKIKDWCSFATDSNTKITVNINSWGWPTKNNVFFMQTETDSWLFLVDVWQAGFLDITLAGAFFQIKNAVFQNWVNGMILSRDGNSLGGLVITDSKFEVSNQIMRNPSWDPSFGNFEVKNSLIEINKKYGNTTFRLPSYFHDNIVNYRSLTNSIWEAISAGWIFWGFNNTMKQNKNMWIVNNKFNLHLNFQQDNFNNVVNANTNLMTWLWWADSKKFLVLSNEFNFLYPDVNNYISSLTNKYNSANATNMNNTIFINNSFNNLKKIENIRALTTCSYTSDHPNYSEQIMFVNNTFDNWVEITNYNKNYFNLCSGYSDCSSKNCTSNNTVVWFNNLNAFTTHTLWGKNILQGESWKWLRVAIDLNYDWNITSSEIISDQYCSPKPNCQNSLSPFLTIY